MSCYIGFIRRALIKAGYPDIPVISLSVQGLEANSGFTYTLPMIKKAAMAIQYGDIFMNVVYRTRPYEAVPGSANALHEKCHISRKNPHRLKTFRIPHCFSGSAPVDGVPVLTRCDRHVADRKILI